MDAQRRILRFVLAERLAHWVYAGFFLLAAVSGLLMWIPATRVWMGGVRQSVIHYHGAAGLVMVFAPLALFLYLDRHRLVEDIHQIDLWDLDDTEWFWEAARGGTLRHRPMPDQGRLNAGQKMHAILVSAIAVGFVVTGGILLAKRHFAPGLVSPALSLHIVLAVVAIGLFLIHLAHAVLTGHGRESLRAMVVGTMAEAVAREHHHKWWCREAGGVGSGPGGHGSAE